MEENKSNLPRLSIKEKMAMAINSPERYTVEELEAINEEWQKEIEHQKVLKVEAKAKQKILNKFEKSIDDLYAPAWKATFKTVGEKIKNIKFKKYKE